MFVEERDVDGEGGHVDRKRAFFLPRGAEVDDPPVGQNGRLDEQPADQADRPHAHFLHTPNLLEQPPVVDVVVVAEVHDSVVQARVV